MGFFNRAAVVTGPGTTIGDGDNPPTIEDIVEKLDPISSLKDGKLYFELNEQVGDAINAFNVPAQSSGDSGSEPKISSAGAVFEAMPDAFNAEAAAGVDVVFQYHISGDGGGDWSCEVKDGTCTIKSGIHDKPTCTLKMADIDFIDMINGILPAMQAYTSGKLKIEGDIMKSQLIEKLFKL